MNDLFRAIFGEPSNDRYGRRMDDTSSINRNNLLNNGGDDDDDDDEDNNMGLNRSGEMGVFGFPFFNDPVDIHKHFEKLLDEMNKSFGVFGFGAGPSITWEDENSNMSFSSHFKDQPQLRQESLRDSFLKQPECKCDRVNVNDFNLNSEDDNSVPGTSNISNSGSQFSSPKIYSKSVFIQTVRRPDGTVETIKKVRDNTGNEQTTITQNNVNDPLPPLQDDPTSPPQGDPFPPMQDDPHMHKEDSSGISILRKFFPF